MALTLIAACARNRAIGKDNALPWHLPEDLAHFRALTAGCPVIMGRLTWESLPARFRPLPGRRNIVVSRRGVVDAPSSVDVATSLEAALALVQSGERVFVIGGAQLYAAALPLAEEIYLTEIDAEVEGDAFFPEFDRAVFVEQSRTSVPATPARGFAFAFVRYQRKPASSGALPA